MQGSSFPNQSSSPISITALGASGQQPTLSSGISGENSNGVTVIPAAQVERNIPEGQSRIPARPLEKYYWILNTGVSVTFYTHHADNLQDENLNKKPCPYYDTYMQEGFIADLSFHPQQAFSIHDQLEFEGGVGVTPSFWQYMKEEAKSCVEGRPEKNEMDHLHDYFKKYPHKLDCLKRAEVLMPCSGYYSQRNSPWLSSVITQLFLLLKKDKNEEGFIAVIDRESASVQSAHVPPIADQAEALSPAGELSDKLLSKIITNVVGENTLTRQGLVDTLLGKLPPVDQYSTNQLANASFADSKNPDETLFKAWSLYTSTGDYSEDNDLITLKSTLMYLCLEYGEYEQYGVERGQLFNAINSKISNIDNVIDLVESSSSLSVRKRCIDNDRNEQLKATAVSSVKLSDYINRLEERPFKNTSIPKPVSRSCDILSHDLKFSDDKARGIFYVSTGSAGLEKGIEEVVRESPITAKELCNIGRSADISNNHKLESYIKFTATSIYYRPTYLGLDTIDYTALYSRSEVLSALMTMINQQCNRTMMHSLLQITQVPVDITSRTVIPNQQLADREDSEWVRIRIKRSFKFLSDREVRVIADEQSRPALHPALPALMGSLSISDCR